MLSLNFGGAVGAGSVLFNRNKRPSSPSFMAGPKSPYSPIGAGANQFYSAQSPTSRTDPFHRAQTPLEQQHHAEGLNSPYSALTLGTNSTTNLLGDKGSKSPPTQTTQLNETSQSIDRATAIEGTAITVPQPALLEKPALPHIQEGNRDSSVAPNFGLFACDTKSMAGSGIGTLVPEYTAFSSPLEQLRESEKSEEGTFSPLTPANFNVLTNPEIATPSRVAFPLSPLRREPTPPEATYYTFMDNEPSKYNKVGKRKSLKPSRPRRPAGEGLLDWLGIGISKTLERSASWKRRKDDANSQRSDFLKV